MNELIKLGIEDKKGVLVVGSRMIAEVFEKEHKNVIQAIEKSECSKEFSRLNFQPSNYKDRRGKKQPEYLLTFDGFSFIAMGFTGSKAAQFKEAYIKEFNRRGDELKIIRLTKDIRNDLTGVLEDQGIIQEMHGHGVENVTNYIIYQIAFGKTASQLRVERGLKPRENVRTHLTMDEKKLVAKIENDALVLFDLGYSYQEVKQILMERVNPHKRLVYKLPCAVTSICTEELIKPEEFDWSRSY